MRLFPPRYPCLRRVVVNVKSGTALRGLLWERRGGYLVLREAELLVPRQAPTSMDGEVAIPAEAVDFIQVLNR
jgi:hypothetical protein